MRLFDRIFGDKYDRRMKKVKKYNTNVLSEECWNLDTAFVDWIVPRLKVFRKEASRIIDYDFTVVDQIIEGFELYTSKFDWDLSDEKVIKDNLKRVDNSMKLFAEHWREFWW